LTDGCRHDPPAEVDLADVTPITDVFVVLGSGWHATCECGLEVVVESQLEGWAWVLDHGCNPMPE
jgi:hypothetical protein